MEAIHGDGPARAWNERAGLRQTEIEVEILVRVERLVVAAHGQKGIAADERRRRVDRRLSREQLSRVHPGLRKAARKQLVLIREGLAVAADDLHAAERERRISGRRECLALPLETPG